VIVPMQEYAEGRVNGRNIWNVENELEEVSLLSE